MQLERRIKEMQHTSRPAMPPMGRKPMEGINMDAGRMEEMKKLEERRREEVQQMDERRKEEWRHMDEMNRMTEQGSSRMPDMDVNTMEGMRQAAPLQERSLYRSARWTCQDGTEFSKDGSCSDSWARIAEQFCIGKCGESGKCGVNSFAVGEICGSENSQCGNGRCEPWESGGTCNDTPNAVCAPSCPEDCLMPLDNTCGNNRCEDGEANQIIGNGGYSAEGMALGEPLEMRPGSCPSDCERPEPKEMHFCYGADGAIATDPALCDQTIMQKKFEGQPRLEDGTMPPREQPYCFDKEGNKTSDPSLCDMAAMQEMFRKEQGDESMNRFPQGRSTDMPNGEGFHPDAPRINIAGIASKALTHINELLQRVPEGSQSQTELESLLQYVGGLIATYGGKTLSPEETEHVTQELRMKIEGAMQTLREEGVTGTQEGGKHPEQIGSALEHLRIVIRTVLPKVFLFLADKNVADFDLSGALEIAGTVASSHDAASKACEDTAAADCKPALTEVFAGMKKLENLMRGPIEQSGLMEDIETFFREAMPKEERNMPEARPQESAGPYLQ